MSAIHTRRSFVSILTSAAGVVLGSAVASPVEAAQSGRPGGGPWDVSWLDAQKGTHKQLYDLGSADLGADPRALRFARNFLDTFRDAMGLQFPDVNTAVGISGPAFPMNASDRIWAKYQLGERFKITDPRTKAPAVRNIFLDDGDISITMMQSRGTVFWQCNVALGAVAQQLAEATKMPVAEVRADLVAGLNPGVQLMPSHVMALALAQERGFTYMKP